jgi:hypothetical protein
MAMVTQPATSDGNNHPCAPAQLVVCCRIQTGIFSQTQQTMCLLEVVFRAPGNVRDSQYHSEPMAVSMY